MQVYPATMDGTTEVAIRCLALAVGATKGDFKRFSRHMAARMQRRDPSSHLVPVLGAYLDWQVCVNHCLGLALCYERLRAQLKAELNPETR